MLKRLPFSKMGLVFCSVALGGAVAWATTGLFRFTFVQGLLFGIALSIGGIAIGGPWLWLAAPLFVLSGWFTQTWTLAWDILWPLLVLMPLVGERTLGTVQFLTPLRLNLSVYVILILSVFFGAVPVWCLLALFTLPVAWQVENVEPESRTRLLLLLELFITIGYLIKGLVR